MIGFLCRFHGWKEGHPDYGQQFWGSLRGPCLRYEDMPKDIATDGFWLGLAEEIVLPFGNR